MYKNVFSTILVSTLLVSVASSAWADEHSKFDPNKPLQDPVESKSQEGGVDVEVTGDATMNSTTPVEMRAGPYSCDVHIDNRTNWYIHRVYIDGSNWGSVGRFGDSIARNVSIGRTKVYAEADFTDGSKRYWGPNYFDCTSYATFTWKLQ
jgi:hypothetical protein